jgi:D-alanine transaminase
MADQPTVYLNGQYLPRGEAKLDIEDRGTLFADGVYEVVHFYGGSPFAMQAHVDRMRRSLAAIDIACDADFAAISDELIRRNDSPHASVYWQVTRGPARRDHVIPDRVTPTVLLIVYPDKPFDMHGRPRQVSAMLHEDMRWSQCWIKSLMLLPNVLAKSKARAAGAFEAIQHRGGSITEGTSTNVFIARGGELWTHPADQFILGGITRDTVLHLAADLSIVCHEQPFTVDALLSADEVMLTGTSTHVAAVTRIDDRTIGDGQAGAMTRRLHDALMRRIARDCGLER